MKYDVISAACHSDLVWLRPALLPANASAAVKDRMPYVADGPRGREWVTKNGASFGLDCGMGSAGRLYEPGKIHRSDRMASTGLYDPEQQKIRRLTNPDLRLDDQGRDGIQAEVLYGILGATSRLNDDEAAGEMLRIYNDWLADFCSKQLERYAGVLEHRPSLKIVIGEAGTGWIPYILDRMDAEWEDQFKELDLKMKPSDYWYRQCYATYQSDPIGVKLIEELGVDNIMWGSDFPHPDGIYPDSKEYIHKELGHLPADVRKKIVCDNAAKLYRFVN